MALFIEQLWEQSTYPLMADLEALESRCTTRQLFLRIDALNFLFIYQGNCLIYAEYVWRSSLIDIQPYNERHSLCDFIDESCATCATFLFVMNFHNVHQTPFEYFVFNNFKT